MPLFLSLSSLLARSCPEVSLIPPSRVILTENHLSNQQVFISFFGVVKLLVRGRDNGCLLVGALRHVEKSPSAEWLKVAEVFVVVNVRR